MVRIEHTRLDGTVVYGTSKGDGSAPVLKGAGFRWAPSIKAWIVPQSRDRAVKSWHIERARVGLEAAGFEVEVSIDDTPRDFAAAEADRAARVEDRAERLEGAAERAARESEARYARARQELDVIPPGQPILVGHHSEKGHRAALKRIGNNFAKSSEEYAKAKHYERAASVAGDYVARRESVPTTLRRIAKLEAEERKLVRDAEPCKTSGMKGKADKVYAGKVITCPVCYNLVRFGLELRILAHGRRISEASRDARLPELADELAYWRRVVADQEEDGAKVWGPADFKKGDRVKYWGGWREVLKVNAKSLTVSSGYSWSDRVPFDKVVGRMSAEELEGPADECDGGDR